MKDNKINCSNFHEIYELENLSSTNFFDPKLW